MSSLDCEKECSDILLPGGWCLVLSVPWPISPTSCDTFLKRLQEKKMLQTWQISVFWLCNALPEKPHSPKAVILKPEQEMRGQAGQPGGQPRKPGGGALGTVNWWEMAFVSTASVLWVYVNCQKLHQEEWRKERVYFSKYSTFILIISHPLWTISPYLICAS